MGATVASVKAQSVGTNTNIPADIKSDREDIVLRLNALTHSFPDASKPVFEAIDLKIRRGEFVAIVGGSGVGKSTLLRCAAGLIDPSSGDVQLDIPQVTGSRRRAIVFQDGRLLPWRTIAGNIEFGLEDLELSKSQKRERIADMLSLTMLDELADRWPHQISGGQMQRTGIARALAVKPALLLMDEPFSAVDALTRQVLQDELLRIWRAAGPAVLFVTHDIHEAILLADRILVLGGSPASVALEKHIHLPRPRVRTDIELFKLASEISSAL